MRRLLRPTILLQAVNALLLLAILLVQLDVRWHMPPTIGELRSAKGWRLRALQSRITRQSAEVDGSVGVDGSVEVDDGTPLRVIVEHGTVTVEEPVTVRVER